MRESIAPRPLLPMPTATVSRDKPDSKLQVGRSGGPGDRHVSSRMQIQSVMRESRRSRPPMSGKFRFVDVRMSCLAQGRKKKSGRQRERDDKGTTLMHRCSRASRHSQTKEGRNAPWSLPTLSVTAREGEKGSKKLEFVFWEGPEERQTGMLDCDGEGSNLQTKTGLGEESGLKRLRNSADSSTFSHGRRFLLTAKPWEGNSVVNNSGCRRPPLSFLPPEIGGRNRTCTRKGFPISAVGAGIEAASYRASSK